MKACFLGTPAAVESNPLQYGELETPEPGAREVLVRVQLCGVCRTVLRVIEGELPAKRSPVIPGHQVVGRIVARGSGAERFAADTRVGIAWLHKTDGTCEYCRRSEENLCDAPLFTGYSENGGCAEYIVAPQVQVVPLEEANWALNALKNEAIPGAAVLRVND
jgi:alcohol dehydrogenase, propanol-preferring